MRIQNFTKIIMLSAIICSASAFAEEASTTEKVTDTAERIIAPASKNEALAELEASRRVIMEMKAPRDQHMAAVGELAKQMEARRAAILEKNEEAATLNADIEDLDKALQEKTLALRAIFDADQELLSLQVKLQEAHDNFGKNQLKLREEIARQHRERRLAMEKAAQQKEADAAAKAVETAPGNSGK